MKQFVIKAYDSEGKLDKRMEGEQKQARLHSAESRLRKTEGQPRTA